MMVCDYCLTNEAEHINKRGLNICDECLDEQPVGTSHGSCIDPDAAYDDSMEREYE